MKQERERETESDKEREGEETVIEKQGHGNRIERNKGKEKGVRESGKREEFVF